jgi:hypothetical protein
MAAVCSWRHRGYPMAVDDEPFASRVNEVSRSSDYRFEYVPVFAAIPGASEHISPCRRRNAEINDPAYRRISCGSHVQPWWHARRRIDHNCPFAINGRDSQDGQRNEAYYQNAVGSSVFQVTSCRFLRRHRRTLAGHDLVRCQTPVTG